MPYSTKRWDGISVVVIVIIIIIIISVLVLLTCIVYPDLNYFIKVEQISSISCITYKHFLLINIIIVK